MTVVPGKTTQLIEGFWPNFGPKFTHIPIEFDRDKLPGEAASASLDSEEGSQIASAKKVDGKSFMHEGVQEEEKDVKRGLRRAEAVKEQATAMYAQEVASELLRSSEVNTAERQATKEKETIFNKKEAARREKRPK